MRWRVCELLRGKIRLLEKLPMILLWLCYFENNRFALEKMVWIKK